MNLTGDDHVSFSAMHTALSPDRTLLAVATDQHRLLVLLAGSSGAGAQLLGPAERRLQHASRMLEPLWTLRVRHAAGRERVLLRCERGPLSRRAERTRHQCARCGLPSVQGRAVHVQLSISTIKLWANC